MALFNLVQQAIASSGTGTLTLGAAVTGFLTMAQAGAPNGAQVSYAILNGDQTEVGRGTYSSSAGTITRGVLRSTNNNALINIAGVATVIVTALAEDFNDITSSISSLTTTVGQKINSSRFANAFNIGGTPNMQIAGPGYMILHGTTVFTPDGNGDQYVAYPVAFTSYASCMLISTDPGTSSGGVTIYSIRGDYQGNVNGFVVRAKLAATGAANTGPQRINYMAIGGYST